MLSCGERLDDIELISYRIFLQTCLCWRSGIHYSNCNGVFIAVFDALEDWSR